MTDHAPDEWLDLRLARANADMFALKMHEHARVITKLQRRLASTRRRCRSQHRELSTLKRHRLSPPPPSPGERDYLAYAARNLQSAVDKREDAPGSSAEHEMSARVALNIERVPTYAEIVEAWKHGDQQATETPQAPTVEGTTAPSTDSRAHGIGSSEAAAIAPRCDPSSDVETRPMPIYFGIVEVLAEVFGPEIYKVEATQLPAWVRARLRGGSDNE